MSSNKRVRELLIARYGNIDFMEELKVAPMENRKYTSKGQRERMERLTMHHIVPKAQNGATSVENGSLLRERNHIWLHQQPVEVQNKLNNAFQELKRRKDNELPVEEIDIDQIPFELQIADIMIDNKGKIKVYNRAKVKEEMRKLMVEELEKE